MLIYKTYKNVFNPIKFHIQTLYVKYILMYLYVLFNTPSVSLLCINIYWYTMTQHRYDITYT